MNRTLSYAELNIPSTCVEVNWSPPSGVRVSGIDCDTDTALLFGSSGIPGDGIKISSTSDCFRLGNDRLGLFPIYYSQPQSNRLLLSNSIDALIKKGACTQLDDDALAVFLRMGYFLGSDTPFAHIHAMPPNSEFKVTSGGVVLEQRDWRVSAFDRMPSREEAQREFGYRVQKVIDGYLARYVNKEIMVPISGGRDSRHLLLAILKAGKRPNHLVTVERFAPNGNEDIPAAQALCAAARLNTQILRQGEDLVNREIVNFHLSSHCVDENNWMFPVMEYFAALDGRALLFDGLAGDILSAGLYNSQEKMDLFAAGKTNRLAELILSRECSLRPDLTEQALRRWSAERAKVRLQAELNKYVGEANPTGHFLLRNRCLREVAHIPRTLLGRFGVVATPFLHPDVIDYMIDLPGEYFLDKRFHTEVINQQYPEFSGVPYAVKGGFTSASLQSRWRLAREGLRYINQSPGMGSVIRNEYLWPRVIKGLLSARYGSQTMYSMMTVPLYLATISRVTAENLFS